MWTPYYTIEKEKNNTVKHVYNDHLGDNISVFVIDRWSL